MNTSKYDAQTRKSLKRDQRTPAYRELQRRAAEERSKLETALAALHERDATIERLKKKLVAAGFETKDVETLAA